MKTVVVYYSLTGKTQNIVNTIRNTIESEIIEIREIRNRSKFNAFIFGSIEAHFKNSSNTFPLNVNIDDYENIIIATPIWAGSITPAIYNFIRGYNLKNKNVSGIFCYGSDCKNAEQIFKEEIQCVGANFKNVVKIKYDRFILEDLKNGYAFFEMDEDKNLYLKNKDIETFANTTQNVKIKY